jgi:hypothetical protein
VPDLASSSTSRNRPLPRERLDPQSPRSSTTSSSRTSSTTSSATCRCSSTRSVADYMQGYGRGAASRRTRSGRSRCSRASIGTTVEFGLIETKQGLRTYGAACFPPAARSAIASTARTPTDRLRPAAHHADPVQDRHLPGNVFRDPRLQPALRGHGPGFHPVLRPAPGGESLMHPPQCWPRTRSITGASRRRARPE